jgi:uncharacterized protein with PIN domain
VHREQRFLLTVDLNRLAKWLRLFGFDASVIPAVSVSELIRRAIKEERIVLTRSHKLSKYKRHFPRFLIQAELPEQQLLEILSWLKPDESKFFSRCIVCNRPLYPITKEKVQRLVPPRSYENNEQFYTCRHCGRIYWQGTHWQAMLKTWQHLQCQLKQSDYNS